MLKSLKFTLPLLVLLSGNIDVVDCKIIDNNKLYNRSNTNDTSVELHNTSLNSYNIKAPTEEELKEFWNCIDGNKFFKSIALQLSKSLLNNHLNNIKTFNYKYIKELEDKNSSISTWSYFDAMCNGLQEVINNLNLKSDNYKEKLTIKSLFNNNKYSNELLDKLSYYYLYRNYFSHPSHKTIIDRINHSSKICEQSICDVWNNFDALGFDKIFNKIVKGTLKVKNLLQPTDKDIKPLQSNNKELNDNYNKALDNNSGYFLKLENYDVGICWLDSAFEIVYNSILNIKDKDIENTNFYKFVKFLEQKQKARAQEVKKKNGKEVISKTKKTKNGTMIYYHTTYITDQISILKSFEEFEKQMKKEELEAWNKDNNVQKAKEEIHKLIKKHNESKKKEMERIQKELQDGLNGKKVNSNANDNKEQQYKDNGNSAYHGINLFINLFPELKKIFVPQYNIEEKNDNNKQEEKSGDKEKNNNKNNEEDITCENLFENEINSFNNFTKITNYKLLPYINYELRYSTNKKVITGKYDILTTNNTECIASLPEYMILSGRHYENNNKNISVGMKFDENLNKYIVGFNGKSELLIYEISSMAMNKSGAEHAYSMYKDNNGWYIMDDHNKYYKLKPEEFKEIIEKDKVETFVYKQLYCNKLDVEETKKQENKNKTNNSEEKENKNIKQQDTEKKNNVEVKNNNKQKLPN